MEREDKYFCHRQENRYQNRDARNYIKEGEPRALYWYKYRETYNFIKKYISQGCVISSPLKIDQVLSSDTFLSNYVDNQDETLLDVPIIFVGNNKLKPFDFDIRKKDRCIVNSFNYPGKSCTIGFSDNLPEICGAIFDRDSKRQDRMYITTISQIENCNYSVYYLPMKNQPLHVRLVHRNHIIDPEIHLPPFKDRKNLAETFSINKIRC
jgi:hypothetical protein